MKTADPGPAPSTFVRRRQFTRWNDWTVLAWILCVHLVALAGFFTFSWKALGVCFFLYWLTGSFGINLGYHRFFTHRSFHTPRFVQYLLAICGSMAGEAGPIYWVAAHRYHHTYSDLEKDPHSPLKGFWWSYVTWLFGREDNLAKFESYKKYTPDMADDKFLVWLDRWHVVPSLFLAAVLYLLGGWSFVVWGIFVRSVLVYHATWLVNSASHVWGYRSYKTPDQSRNNWWVAIVSLGEGWHNNHHAFQRSARHGFRWWEIDPTYCMVQVLWLLGLASDIHLPVRTSPIGLTIPVTNLTASLDQTSL